MNVLILGATGMLGHIVFRAIASDARYNAFGTIRNATLKRYFDKSLITKLITISGIERDTELQQLITYVKPDVIINCIGIVKQREQTNDVYLNLTINSLLPHRLSELASRFNARLIHISTDCVFTGSAGNYSEQDNPDATDIYGVTKRLGEINAAHAITIRTSIVGHELGSANGLLEWFLAQTNCVQGYTRAIFSGLSTVEVARVLSCIVLPQSELNGIYHLSAEPISKYELLKLIAKTYDIKREIIPSEHLIIDRSLNSSKFKSATGYQPPTWGEMVEALRKNK